MIYNVFDPDIRFIWVKYQNTKLQKERLNQRAATYGNPISAELYDYMLEYWEDPTIPHYSLMNDPDLKHSIKTLLNRWGLCVSWDV
jgi:hypothetical protein